MSKQFFHAENATRILAGQKFEIYDIVAGTTFGVFATELETVAYNLAKLPAVTKITEAEYLDCLKKKLPKYEALSKSSSPSVSPVTLKGNGRAVVVESSPVKEAEPVVITQVETVEDALKVEPVLTAPAPAPIVEAEPEKPKRGGRR